MDISPLEDASRLVLENAKTFYSNMADVEQKVCAHRLLAACRLTVLPLCFACCAAC